MKRPAFLELLAAAGVVLFLVGLGAAVMVGPQALGVLVIAGAAQVAAGALMLVDYRGGGERVVDRMYPRDRFDAQAHPLSRRATRLTTGAIWIFFGVSLVTLGVLALVGVVSDPNNVFA